jgi:hypothetical protein
MPKSNVQRTGHAHQGYGTFADRQTLKTGGFNMAVFACIACAAAGGAHIQAIAVMNSCVSICAANGYARLPRQSHDDYNETTLKQYVALCLSSALSFRSLPVGGSRNEKAVLKRSGFHLDK